MNPLNPLPCFPLCLGGGIIAGWYVGDRFSYLFLVIFLFSISLLILFVGFKRWRGKMARLILCLLLGFFLGNNEARLQTRQRQVLAAANGAVVAVVGTVIETPTVWRQGMRFILRTEEINGSSLTVQPKIEVFLSAPGIYRYGQRLLLKGRLFGDDVVPGSQWARERISGGLMAFETPQALGFGQVAAVGRWIKYIQNQMLAVGEATLPPKAAVILHGMLLGRRTTTLPEGTFEQAGVTHLLSVSGLHLMFWLSLFWGLGKVLHLPDWILGFLAVPVVTLFLLIADGGAPALRAGVMTLLTLFGDLTQRRTRGPQLLAMAAGVIFLLRPLEVFALGFWLSFLACAGLILIFPRWDQAFTAYPLFRKGRAFFLSVAAQLMVFPLIAKVYGGCSLIAPLANLCLVPLAGVAVQIGLIAALCGLAWLPLARLLNAGNAVIINLFWKLANLFADLPGYLCFPPWPWLTVGACYGVIFLLTWGLTVNPVTKKRRLPLFYILLTLALIGLLVTGHFLRQDLAPHLEIVFFDVGQGDAALITVPGDYHILVDGGEAAAYNREIRPYLQARGIRELDLVVVTHPHEDHLGGIVRLLEDGRISVEQVLESGFPHTTRLYQRFLQLILEQEVTLRQGVRGTALRVGDLKGLVLNPPPTYLGGIDGDQNNNSLVLLLDYQGVRILLSGDAEAPGEAEMIATYGEGLRANLLKIGHHGSPTGTGGLWLARVEPEIGVISVGAGNSFGHPGQAVLARLAQAGVKVYRTDQVGRLTFTIRPGRSGKQAQIRVESEVTR